eukprot:5114719-Prymnesium_polylepis.1
MEKKGARAAHPHPQPQRPPPPAPSQSRAGLEANPTRSARPSLNTQASTITPSGPRATSNARRLPRARPPPP